MGYHGCERDMAWRILLGESDLEASTNDYDWLGHGIYFWEHGLTRARQFAEEKKRRGEVKHPFVIGAYIQLGHCLDLTDVWATRLVARYFRQLRAASRGRDFPVNGPTVGQGKDLLLRRLDCAVINLGLGAADKEARSEHRAFGFDTVRGVFEEGPAAFPGAGVREKSHVQVSVRNPACILGVFRPSGYSFHGGERRAARDR